MLCKWQRCNYLWARNSDVDNALALAPLASENIDTIEMRSGYSVLPHGSSDLMNSVFTISFFPSKLNMYDGYILDLFF